MMASSSPSSTNRSIRSAAVNTRVTRLRPLLPPACLIDSLRVSSSLQSRIVRWRASASNIVHHRDDRILLIIGPCSIHDTKAAIEYANKLAAISPSVSNEILIVMRCYFEKPRTTIGWKGLINDPTLDGANNINAGLHLSRALLLRVNTLGLPAATEFLDTITPQYYADLITWGAIGARTTESQLHRELVSGLSMPVGFKNGTSGNIKVAVDGIVASRFPHAFPGVTRQGLAAIIETVGNPDCHIILRGSDKATNYSDKDINETNTLLEKSMCERSIMIDCSHGNSSKDYRKQALVCESVCQQIEAGNTGIIGFMIESNLVEGQQTLTIQERSQHSNTIDELHDNEDDEEEEAGESGVTSCGSETCSNPVCSSNRESNIRPSKYSNCGNLKYGQSVTDGCIGWEETVNLINRIAQAVRKRREVVAKAGQGSESR